jgi:type IV pilus assembly protein PilC
MPTFSYKVKNDAGKIFVGEAKIDTRVELIKMLADKGLIPVEIVEKSFVTDITQLNFFKQKVKVKDLALFCRQFSIVLQAGLPISTAMDVLRGQTSNKSLKDILSDVYESIQKGNSLSSSMKKHPTFPQLLVHMVESGEMSGQLDIIFNRMAEFYENETKVNKRIKGAMIYPAILVIVSVVVIFVLMTFVLPQFAETLDSFNVEYPLPTKVVMGLSDFFSAYWYIITILGAVIFGGITFFLRTFTGKRTVSMLSLKIPVLNTLTKNIITARFTRTLSTLLVSGVLLIEALEMVQKIIGNIIITEKFETVIDEVKRGKSLTNTITAMKFFPPLVLSMVRIGEESGGLDFSLEKSADYFDQEVDSSISSFLTMLEPIILFFLAFIIGFIVLSVLLLMTIMYESAI